MNLRTVKDILVGAVIALFCIVVSALAGWGLAHLVDDIPLMIEAWKALK